MQADSVATLNNFENLKTEKFKLQLALNKLSQQGFQSKPIQQIKLSTRSPATTDTNILVSNSASSKVVPKLNFNSNVQSKQNSRRESKRESPRVNHKVFLNHNSKRVKQPVKLPDEDVLESIRESELKLIKYSNLLKIEEAMDEELKLGPLKPAVFNDQILEGAIKPQYHMRFNPLC